jgi:hypothetical protein
MDVRCALRVTRLCSWVHLVQDEEEDEEDEEGEDEDEDDDEESAVSALRPQRDLAHCLAAPQKANITGLLLVSITRHPRSHLII